MGNSSSSPGSALPPLPDPKIDTCIEHMTAALPARTQRIGILRDRNLAVLCVVCVWFDITANTPHAAELCLDEATMRLLYKDLQSDVLDGVRLHDKPHFRSLETGVPGLRRHVQACFEENGSMSLGGTTEQLYDLVVQTGNEGALKSLSS